ncbi:MAG: hypothetical protein C0513_06165 [Isosphaera sp.]|nr:hypothetical protein [Isosphaera sp.]
MEHTTVKVRPPTHFLPAPAHARRRGARCAALAPLALTLLAGCEVDSYLDPSRVGRWEHTPATLPLLDRLSIIEGPADADVEVVDIRPEDLLPTVEEYRVGPGDGLSVFVESISAPGFPTQIRVDSRGFIANLPGGLGVPVFVSGLTVTQIRARVARAYAEQQILANASVEVTALEQRDASYSVLGAVAVPGRYQIPEPDFRVLEAVNQAGRFADNTPFIFVIRQVPLSEAARGAFPDPTPSDPAAPDGPRPPVVPIPGRDPQRPSPIDVIENILGEPPPPPPLPTSSDPPAPSPPTPQAHRSGPRAAALAQQGTPLAQHADVGGLSLSVRGGAQPVGDPGVATPPPRRPVIPLPAPSPAESPAPPGGPSQSTPTSPPPTSPPPPAPPALTTPSGRGRPAAPGAPTLSPPAETGRSSAAPGPGAQTPQGPLGPPAQVQDATWVFLNGEWVPTVRPSGDAAAQQPGAERPARANVPGAEEPPAQLPPRAPAEPEQLFTQVVIRVPTAQLVAGAASVNIVIRPGDIIRVPDSPSGVYYIGGEIARGGSFNLPAPEPITLARAVTAAGGLGNLAIPERTELTRLIPPNRQANIRVNLRAIFENNQPDIILKPGDHIIVGTNFFAFPLVIFRNGLRFSYGFGFLLDRNFGPDVFGAVPIGS